MNDIVTDLRKALSTKLNPSRYEHTLSVSYTAMVLAMRYSCSLEKAELAGLLHDCAKHYSDESIIRKCEKRQIPLTEDELKAPAVLHAKYGAWVAEHKYGIDDPEILGAVRYHTTGKADMSLLEKIIFVADYIEPRRDKAANLPTVRPLAFSDLDACMYIILKDTLEYLEEKGSYIDTMTIQAYDYYKGVYEARADV